MVPGAETVTKLVGNAVVTFAENPDQWQMLLADRSKIPAAVEELLRWEAPAQYLVRYNLKDVELHGTTIPAGNPVLLCLGSANRDERAFSDADTFDINRDRAEAQNLGLGYGVHSCLGAALARMESAIALDKLLDFMPRYEVRRDGLNRVAMTNVDRLAHRAGAGAALSADTTSCEVASVLPDGGQQFLRVRDDRVEREVELQAIDRGGPGTPAHRATGASAVTPVARLPRSRRWLALRCSIIEVPRLCPDRAR